MRTTLMFTFLCFACNLFSQLSPEITSWLTNTDGDTGYDGIETNVQQVQFSDDNVYISCTCIPGYDIGPWIANPNVPVNQNFVYKITRTPEENTGILVETPMGHTGVWSNGVSVFNAKDGMSFENEGIWNQNAVVVEGISFDNCLGHPAPNGEYHHHLNPTCLYDDENISDHAPIIGYAFDGFPIYGAFGYTNVDGTGGISRMGSSYQFRTISERTTLPDGTVLPVSEHGPDVSASFPLGYYIEDHEYIAGSGDLDAHNGRFCVTPEYPDGIYAYFVTLTESGEAEYPYTLGPHYYGLVQAGNTGPMSGHNTISEAVETYVSIGEFEGGNIKMLLYPNPVTEYLFVYLEPSFNNNLTLKITDLAGNIILTKQNMQPDITYSFDLQNLNSGIYFIHVADENINGIQKIIVTK